MKAHLVLRRRETEGCTWETGGKCGIARDGRGRRVLHSGEGWGGTERTGMTGKWCEEECDGILREDLGEGDK